ncbi:hypothetical protein T492DRAFT_892072 [Pavlovales sp. CCMP2436]|nr:hypothetical protein T492DRAFT_892072 [Pavlovales sp. CCMP2436]
MRAAASIGLTPISADAEVPSVLMPISPPPFGVTARAAPPPPNSPPEEGWQWSCDECHSKRCVDLDACTCHCCAKHCARDKKKCDGYALPTCVDGLMQMSESYALPTCVNALKVSCGPGAHAFLKWWHEEGA